MTYQQAIIESINQLTADARKGSSLAELKENVPRFLANPDGFENKRLLRTLHDMVEKEMIHCPSKSRWKVNKDYFKKVSARRTLDERNDKERQTMMMTTMIPQHSTTFILTLPSSLPI